MVSGVLRGVEGRADFEHLGVVRAGDVAALIASVVGDH